MSGAISKCCVLSKFSVPLCVWECFPGAECVPPIQILPEVPSLTVCQVTVIEPVHNMVDFPAVVIMWTVIIQLQVLTESMTASFRVRLREHRHREQEPFKRLRIRPRTMFPEETKSCRRIIIRHHRLFQGDVKNEFRVSM